MQELIHTNLIIQHHPFRPAVNGTISSLQLSSSGKHQLARIGMLPTPKAQSNRSVKNRVSLRDPGDRKPYQLGSNQVPLKTLCGLTLIRLGAQLSNHRFFFELE